MSKDTLLAIGEALIDFIPHQTGCDFDDVKAFSPKCGGAPANVCGAYTVMGGKSKIITQLGCDPFGNKIANELKFYGIDTSCISFTDKANTALAFVSISEKGDRTFSFYRNPSADMLMNEKQIKSEWFEDVYVLHYCSVSLGDFPMKKAHIQAIEYAHKNGTIVSFDPNLRFMLWEDKEALFKTIWEFIPKSNILKISDEELEFITGEKDIHNALPKLICGDVKLIIYTCGKNGAYAFTKNIEVFSKGLNVQANDTTGAGDGFIGSFLYALNSFGVTLENLDSIEKTTLNKCLDSANNFCSHSVQNYGAIASYRKIKI